MLLQLYCQFFNQAISIESAAKYDGLGFFDLRPEVEESRFSLKGMVKSTERYTRKGRAGKGK